MTLLPRARHCSICNEFTRECCVVCAAPMLPPIYVCDKESCQREHAERTHSRAKQVQAIAKMATDGLVRQIDAYLVANFTTARPLVVPPFFYDHLAQLGIGRLDHVRRNDPLPLTPPPTA